MELKEPDPLWGLQSGPPYVGAPLLGAYPCVEPAILPAIGCLAPRQSKGVGRRAGWRLVLGGTRWEPGGMRLQPGWGAWGHEVRALLCRETTGAGMEEHRGGALSDSPISADSVPTDATPVPTAWAAVVCPARNPK